MTSSGCVLRQAQNDFVFTLALQLPGSSWYNPDEFLAVHSQSLVRVESGSSQKAISSKLSIKGIQEKLYVKSYKTP